MFKYSKPSYYSLDGEIVQNQTLGSIIRSIDVGRIDSLDREHDLSNRALLAVKWGVLAAFFGFTIVGLFSYLRSSRSITDAHLYTAVSIYLLIGILWFAVYSAIDAIKPNSILLVKTARTTREGDLLYFSLVTLSTIGYGGVVPLNSEVRILAALEGIAGVLYVAITIAVLVGSYMQQRRSG